MPGAFSPLASGILVAVVVAPLITTPYLLVRARRQRGPAPTRVGDVIERPSDAVWYTVLTVVLLLIGGVVVQYVGWIIGLALLWGSRTWRPVDKIIGSFAPPFGGLVSVWLITGRAFPGYDGQSPLPFGVLVLVWALAALPLVTFVYLLVRARILRR